MLSSSSTMMIFCVIPYLIRDPETISLENLDSRFRGNDNGLVHNTGLLLFSPAEFSIAHSIDVTFDRFSYIENGVVGQPINWKPRQIIALIRFCVLDLTAPLFCRKIKSDPFVISAPAVHRQ